MADAPLAVTCHLFVLTANRYPLTAITSSSSPNKKPRRTGVLF